MAPLKSVAGWLHAGGGLGEGAGDGLGEGEGDGLGLGEGLALAAGAGLRTAGAPPAPAAGVPKAAVSRNSRPSIPETLAVPHKNRLSPVMSASPGAMRCPTVLACALRHVPPRLGTRGWARWRHVSDAIVTYYLSVQ